MISNEEHKCNSLVSTTLLKHLGIVDFTCITQQMCNYVYFVYVKCLYAWLISKKLKDDSFNIMVL